MKIKKNDTVVITTGKDKGKKGKVIQVLPSEDMVVVEGLNVRKKNVRAKRQGEKGQVVSYSAPVHVSNVRLWVSKHPSGVRIGFEKDAQGNKIRINKKDGTPIS